MNTSWQTYATRSPWWVIGMLLLLVVGMTAGSQYLTYRGEYQIFFSEENDKLKAFEEIEATFNKADNISIVVAPTTGSVFTAERLSLIRELTKAAVQTPYSNRVDSIANYQHTQALEDDLHIGDLIGPYTSLDAAGIAAIEKVALQEPRLVHSAVSADGDVAVITITVQIKESERTSAEQEIYRFVDELIATYQPNYPDIQFHKAGIIALNMAFNDAAQQDATTIVPAMFLTILIFLALMLRSITGVIATLVIIVSTILATMGAGGWLGMFLSVTTVNVPTLVMTLAVADCVHIFATVKQEMERGRPKHDAIAHSLRLNTRPVLITSVTTALGFLMMNASDSPVLWDLGNLSALGVMVACLLSLTLLPALLTVFPMRVKVKSAETAASGWARFADGVIRFQRSILVVMALLTVAGGYLVTQNHVNDNSVGYFAKTSEFRQSADFMEANISGSTTVSVAIKTGEPSGITTPEFLQTLDAFSQWLRQQPHVDHVATLSDTIRNLHMNMHGGDPAYYGLPDDQGLAAQYLLLYEMSLPKGLDLNNEVNVSKSSVRVQVTTQNLGSKELVALEANILQWFSQNAPQLEVMASSPNLMFAHIGETNMKSMLISLPIALVLISGLMIFALRSLRLGLISLVPNIVPAVMGFGLWALISGEINLGLSVVVSLTLGIVVDDSVHFLSKYQYAKKQGSTTEKAVRYAFNTVGRALWITTVVLVAGFSMLATSGFRLNADMGQLSAIVIFLALIIDFLLLPAVLLQFDRRTTAGQTSATGSNEPQPTSLNNTSYSEHRTQGETA
uniref:efflux RND transporter permease subunit n=1 Tax=Thaumasiovibrio occultus TaxID=1891184 RepID=UPI000B351A53|nr:MMPL family transporter [Thaumasiovibrio occultus]